MVYYPYQDNIYGQSAIMMQTKTFEYESQHSTPWHKHELGQLYWLSQGVFVIETECAQWTVTPGSIGWFPAGLDHRAWVPRKVKGNSLYLKPSDCIQYPSQAGIYGGNSFILAMLERVLRNNHVSSKDYQNSLLKLLGYEISQCAELPLQLTLPLDRRARNVANELLRNPACILDQSQLANQWGISVRNLSRLFSQQTGLSFSQWRQQAKVVASLQWVLAGLPISEVASLSGYSNVSAYIEVFRQRFGKTPGQFKED